MATSWRDILPRVLVEREGVAVRSDSSVSAENEGGSPPNRPNGANGTLPAKLAAGVALLAAMPRPRNINPEAWAQIVRDARTIADRWAPQALSLGWCPAELFGAQTDSTGDPSSDGLAVRLDGRRILAITNSFAIVQQGAKGRTYLYRKSCQGCRFLWESGRHGR